MFFFHPDGHGLFLLTIALFGPIACALVLGAFGALTYRRSPSYKQYIFVGEPSARPALAHQQPAPRHAAVAQAPRHGLPDDEVQQVTSAR